VSEDAPTGVGTTAVGVAVVRALESAREDRLFHDPLAGAFVTAAGWERPALEDITDEARLKLGLLAAWIVARTRFLDDLVLDAADAGVRQVVLLGAGLDARAFRLGWPEGTRVFELDTPEMLGFKERVVAENDASPRAERITIPIDLRDDWPAALRDAGFDPDAPSAWIVEGLLVYLPEDAVEKLIGRLSDLAAPGSRMGLTSSSGGSIDNWRDAVGDGVSSMWISALPADPAEWLAGYGWTTSLHDARDKLDEYGRSVGPRRPGSSPSWLIAATRSGSDAAAG
jgi:methyltransferase (TIGR00027 family)